MIVVEEVKTDSVITLVETVSEAAQYIHARFPSTPLWFIEKELNEYDCVYIKEDNRIFKILS